MRFPTAPKHCKMHDGCNFRGTCANCAFVPRILRNGLPPAPLVSSRWRSLGLTGLCEIVRSRVGGYANESPTPGSARWGWRASGHIALHDPTKGTGTAGVSRRTGRKRKRPAIAGEPWDCSSAAGAAFPACENGLLHPRFSVLATYSLRHGVRRFASACAFALKDGGSSVMLRRLFRVSRHPNRHPSTRKPGFWPGFCDNSRTVRELTGFTALCQGHLQVVARRRATARRWHRPTNPEEPSRATSDSPRNSVSAPPPGRRP